MRSSLPVTTVEGDDGCEVVKELIVAISADHRIVRGGGAEVLKRRRKSCEIVPNRKAAAKGESAEISKP
jgi:hypothetical protein